MYQLLELFSYTFITESGSIWGDFNEMYFFKDWFGRF